MKKNFLYIALAFMSASFMTTSCSEDELSPESVITVDKSTFEENDLDRWLTANFLDPYNIQIKYRYEDNESNMSYYEVPTTIDDANILAHILKYCCIEAYDATVGINFTRANFPKLFFFTGEWRYKNNGSFVLGTAEGGKKIFLLGTRYLTPILEGKKGYGDFNFENGPDIVKNLNHYYLKTIHHEFTHILNQTQPYSTSFKLITADSYVSDTWNAAPNNTGYLGRGYISAYAQQEDREDFAETMALYVTNSADQWEAWMKEAATNTNSGGKTGRQLIEQKLSVVRDYMQKCWNIDIDLLRSEILKRQGDVANGTVDLKDLTIN
ncbi:MAG: putative zinc-binding metallopeptidase [Prevotella sp.]|nr:putative zinc-binding metallopeptidase [Prevotella sp.]